jgi:hypothetical protein
MLGLLAAVLTLFLHRRLQRRCRVVNPDTTTRKPPGQRRPGGFSLFQAVERWPFSVSATYFITKDRFVMLL